MIIGTRAKQIDNGSLPKCPIQGLTSSIDIATKEYEMGYDLETIEYIPEPVYKNYEDTCKHTHLESYDGDVFCTNCGLIEKYEFINELCTDYEYHVRVQKDKNNLNEHSKVKDLREAATKIGVKRVTVMSKKQLCKALGIKISNEGKYVLKNLKTGKEYRLKNQKEISDKFGICQGSLSFLLKKGNVTVNGNTYSLEKL